jgi:hypothetical protein
MPNAPTLVDDPAVLDHYAEAVNTALAAVLLRLASEIPAAA